MPKKSNKERSDGRIAVQIYLGIVDGKRKYKTVYGKTQKEADKKAQEIKTRMNIGVDILTESTPFKTYRELWLANKKRSVSESYYRICRGYSSTLSTFDDIEIKKIQSHHLQNLIDGIAEKNPHTGNKTARKTLVDIAGAAKQIFNIAISQGAITKNPAEDIIISSKAPQHRREPITDDQIKWIEETPHRAKTAAMIMLYAGLRRGELLALTWSDVNLKDKTITVNKSVEMLGNIPTVKNHTKTEAGMRVVYIPQKLCDYLSSIKKTSILVCPSESGGVMTNSAFKALWMSYMCDLNIKYGKRTQKAEKYMPKSKNPMIINTFTAHQLRHTFATMLYKAGVDMMTAKSQLGHADINTTLSIYTHLDSIYKKKEICKLDEYLKNASQMQVSNSV